MPGSTLDAFATSTVLVAVAEIGDKTQLLSFALAARYRRAWPIVCGILVATLANHALAGSLGVALAVHLDPRLTVWLVGGSFLAFGIWALVPDRLESAPRPLGGVFLTTTAAFFVAEMGDKTQLATVALGARHAMPVVVTLGTTLGMMIANVPAVLLGGRLAERLPLHAMRYVASALFVATGAATLLFG
ncbi:MAG: TMEM165/GDT1 family protein [Burkholderiales bacterium]|nr:TMEM165/GDT1 family protein [Burkholderiales bacterium]